VLVVCVVLGCAHSRIKLTIRPAQKILQVWFNTMFVTRTQLTFRKHEIDKANKGSLLLPFLP
jgi:hypothetical protein